MTGPEAVVLVGAAAVLAVEYLKTKVRELQVPDPDELDADEARAE